jgi:hypothetical protein
MDLCAIFLEGLMKKILSVIIFLIIINTFIFSQSSENENVDKKFTVQSSPLCLLLNIIALGQGIEDRTYFMMDIEGQYRINDIFNIAFTFSFTITNNFYFYGNDYQINFKPMFIYRPLGTGLRGFFIGFYPTIGWYSRQNVSYEGYYPLINIGFGFDIGYKWVFKNGFTLQLGGGIGKSWFIPEKYSYVSYVMASDSRLVFPKLDFHIIDFKLGYSF